MAARRLAPSLNGPAASSSAATEALIDEPTAPGVGHLSVVGTFAELEALLGALEGSGLTTPVLEDFIEKLELAVGRPPRTFDRAETDRREKETEKAPELAVAPVEFLVELDRLKEGTARFRIDRPTPFTLDAPWLHLTVSRHTWDLLHRPARALVRVEPR